MNALEQVWTSSPVIQKEDNNSSEVKPKDRRGFRRGVHVRHEPFSNTSSFSRDRGLTNRMNSNERKRSGGMRILRSGSSRETPRSSRNRLAIEKESQSMATKLTPTPQPLVVSQPVPELQS